MNGLEGVVPAPQRACTHAAKEGENWQSLQDTVSLRSLAGLHPAIHQGSYKCPVSSSWQKVTITQGRGTSISDILLGIGLIFIGVLELFVKHTSLTVITENDKNASLALTDTLMSLTHGQQISFIEIWRAIIFASENKS